jgi:hypothetical protein
MKIKAIKVIRYKGVEYKPGDELEVPDLFGHDFTRRGLAKLAPEKKVKRKAE